jgi:outer membrane receptor protein involved in Fe transport
MDMEAGRRIATVVAVWAASVAAPVGAQVRPEAVPDTSERVDSLASQRLDYVLEPITVVAPRERASAPPVATISVEPRAIQGTASDNPYDLVRRVTGIEVHDQGQGPGFASNVVLRGFTGDHSSDLLLVVDGVPVNLPVHGHVEGYADWNYLLPGAISSLRVIHGPSSPLYGDFSMAGTMEVYTRPDAQGTAGRVFANGFGDLSGWTTTGTRGERGGGLVGLELRRIEGWRQNSEQQSGNALLRGWRQVGEGRLDGGLSLYGGKWNSPGFLSIPEFEGGDLELAANNTDGGDQKRGVLHGRYAVDLGRDRFLQVMGWGVASDWALSLTVPGHEDAAGELYQTTETDRRLGVGGRVELSWIPGAGELTVGAEGRSDWSEYDLGRSLRRVPIEDLVALDARHASVAGYLRWRFEPVSRLGLDLGARVDYLRNRSYNRVGLDASPSVVGGYQLAVVGSGELLLDPPVLYHVGEGGGPVGQWISGDHALVSPKVGARFDMSDDLSLMASSSRGFRSAVGVVGDPERDPVVTWANEVGLEYDRSRFSAHVSLFRNDVSNERIQDPITLEISSSGSSVRQGIEAISEVGLWGGVRLSGRATLTDAVLSGQYADAHDDHNQAGTGTGDPAAESPEQDVPGVADYLAQVALEAPIWRALEGRVEWRVTGPYTPIGEPDVRTDPYGTLDAGLSYLVRHDLVLDLEVRNVLDRVYPELRSSGYVSPGAPRSISLTLQLLDPVS